MSMFVVCFAWSEQELKNFPFSMMTFKSCRCFFALKEFTIIQMMGREKGKTREKTMESMIIILITYHCFRKKAIIGVQRSEEEKSFIINISFFSDAAVCVKRLLSMLLDRRRR